MNEDREWTCDEHHPDGWYPNRVPDYRQLAKDERDQKEEVCCGDPGDCGDECGCA